MRAKESSSLAGPALIALAAMLWATDSLFRFPTVNSIAPLLIVSVEHLLGTLVLLPWIVLKKGNRLFKLTPREWLAAFFIGAGASAVATILFTASFQYINPSVTILLQKLQPVLVVFIAYLFLGERPKSRFLGWAALALAAGVVLSFPNLDFSFLNKGLDVRSLGVFYALGAAGLWAAATVAGKLLLKKTDPSVATFWRFFFGLLTASILFALSGAPVPFNVLVQAPIARSLLYMSLFPGIIAMLVYYQGLSRTTASVATFMELLFPVSAVVLNWTLLGTPLSPLQIGAGIALLFAITRISQLK